MLNRIALTSTLAVCLAAAAPSGAETLLSGHAGSVFNIDIGPVSGDRRPLSYGGAIAFLGDSGGFEIEGNFTPEFFGERDVDLGENNLTTLMGNLLLGTRFGESGRLYVTVGGGLLKSEVRDVDDFFNVSSSDFGVNGGFGTMGFFGERIGIRADIRYFRNLTDPEPNDEFDIDFGNLSYWRGTAGLVIKF